MNLNAYDAVAQKIDKSKTWIDVDKCQLLSREIKYRPFVTISKRFNKQTVDYDYFIITLDEPPFDRVYTRTRIDDYGRVKINLRLIWQNTSLNTLEQDTNISITNVEHTNDGDIYKLDI